MITPGPPESLRENLAERTLLALRSPETTIFDRFSTPFDRKPTIFGWNSDPPWGCRRFPGGKPTAPPRDPPRTYTKNAHTARRRHIWHQKRPPVPDAQRMQKRENPALPHLDQQRATPRCWAPHRKKKKARTGGPPPTPRRVGGGLNACHPPRRPVPVFTQYQNTRRNTTRHQQNAQQPTPQFSAPHWSNPTWTGFWPPAAVMSARIGFRFCSRAHQRLP
jgi:hypothetical protein